MKMERPLCPSYRQDRGAVRQPITVTSMVLAPPTFRHAPSDHRQGYGIMYVPHLSSQRICSGRFSFGLAWLNSAKRASRVAIFMRPRCSAERVQP